MKGGGKGEENTQSRYGGDVDSVIFLVTLYTMVWATLCYNVSQTPKTRCGCICEKTKKGSCALTQQF